VAGFILTYSNVRIQVIDKITPVLTDRDGVERPNVLREFPLQGESLRRAMKQVKEMGMWLPAKNSRWTTDWYAGIENRMATRDNIQWDPATETLELIMSRLEQMVN